MLVLDFYPTITFNKSNIPLLAMTLKAMFENDCNIKVDTSFLYAQISINDVRCIRCGVAKQSNGRVHQPYI